jgi:hypothetical protein
MPPDTKSRRIAARARMKPCRAERTAEPQDAGWGGRARSTRTGTSASGRRSGAARARAALPVAGQLAPTRRTRRRQATRL